MAPSVGFIRDGELRRARARAKRPRYLWEQVRAAFLLAAVPDWETLYSLATKDGVVAVAVIDTS